MSYKVAVVGATGAVGREMLKTLQERNFPVREVVALASRASVGKQVSFGEKETLAVQALEDYDFSDTEIALFSAGGSVSAEYAPKAAAQGCVVIDNSSHFRMEEDVPLVVPEVNADALEDFNKRNIIANPNCSTIQMVIALKPLHDIAKIKRVVVSTYQSVSGAGKAGMDELYYQTKQHYEGVSHGRKSDPVKFTKRIAFNAIPHIDKFMDDGSTKEEWKMVHETKKILDESIEVFATCVRVPVFVGHSESVNIEFVHEISDEEAREALMDADGVVVFDAPENGGYITPFEASGEDAVYVSRIRTDSTVKNGLAMWVVSDNLRKGAALNAVQIAEALVNRGLVMPMQGNVGFTKASA
jgi:aspartate-semialdehyde dehydrogenase